MDQKDQSPIALLLLAGLTACSPHPLAESWPELRPLAAELPAYRAPQEPPRDDLSRTVFEEPTGVLTLRQALAAALENNPVLAAFSWEVRVREARALQASLLSNPEVGIEIEEFGGTGAASGFDPAETTVILSQLVELGDKRLKRTRVAELDRDLAGWDYEAKRIEVFAQVAKSFVSVVVAQRRIKLAQKNLELAEQVFQAASKRVDVGAATPLDRTKASVVVATSRIELQRAQRKLTAARHYLAATWASTSPLYDSVSAQLETVEPIPPYQQLVSRISQNPDLARWAVEIAQRKANVELAKAQAVPDVTAGAGVRYLNELDDTVYLVEFSVPLPLFDRNQGGILEARFAAAKAVQERRATEVHVRTVLVQAYQFLAAAHDETLSLRDNVLPASRLAFDMTNRAYQEGKAGYLEVLDAQRTLIETQAQYVESLGDYHIAVAEVEGLIGYALNELTDNAKDQEGQASHGDQK